VSTGMSGAVTEPKRRNRPPEFTERDALALMWLGEQYGARLDVLGVLLGRLGGSSEPLSRWGVRNQIERWKRSGLVRTERGLGETWVTPTRHGLDRVGLSYPTWAVPVTRLAHCHAVNVVRLWYEGTAVAAQSPWISERATYQERGKSARWHVPDGVVRDPRSGDGPVRHVAIEVELTHKGRRAYETEVFGNLRAGVESVSYFVPDEAFARRLTADVRDVLARQGSSTRFSVQLLPEVVGVDSQLRR
jgi:hypothetical protein